MLKIYKASAGSGKTYTLALEYIKSLLCVKSPETAGFTLNHTSYLNGRKPAADRHRHILAITFTNKATEEMKRRIVAQLDSLAKTPAPGKPDADYAPALTSLCGCSREHLAQTASAALSQLLSDYGNFHVATIDSFFQRVLRTFARELDCQGDFNIELNDYPVVQKAVDNMLDDYNNDSGHHSELGKWIYGYLSRQLDNGAKTNFFDRSSSLHVALVKLVAKICDEKFKPYSAGIRQYLKDKTALRELIDRLVKLQKALPAEASRTAVSTLTALEDMGVTTGQMKSNSKIKRYLNTYVIPGKMPKAADITDDVWDAAIGNPASVFAKKNGYRGTDEHAAIFGEMLSKVRELLVRHLVYSDILQSLEALGLLGYAWEYLERYTAENNTVLLSDTNHMLRRIIGSDETPFIYERMGIELRHFLIDEFQDTSRMQWGNLRPLVANSLLERFDSLIIGDEKQSIYRFRNSDSSLLHHEVADVDFRDTVYDTVVAGMGKGENTNYRSAADVVRFNNTLFSTLAKSHGVGGFENVVQDIPERNLEYRGYVKFVPGQKKGAAGIYDTLKQMAGEIRRQHSEGGYDWKDIAVLVYTNKEADTVVNSLIDNHKDIPVLSDEALYVKHSNAVQTVVNVLKLLAAGDTLASTSDQGKYKSPSELSRTMNRLEYYRARGYDLPTAIDASEKDEGGDKYPAGIDRVRQRKPSSLAAMIETVIHEHLSPELRRSEYAYLAALQDFAADFASRHTPSLQGFLTYWERKCGTLTITAASELDAVRVMTIHKSKGLEFGCVHIPFGSWDTKGKPRQEWVDFPTLPECADLPLPQALLLSLDTKYEIAGARMREKYLESLRLREADTMNLTYVAYTRAEAELIVYYSSSRGIGKRVAEAMASAAPESAETTCPLPDYYDSATGAFELGAPTRKRDKNTPNSNTQSASGDALSINEYKVFFHEGAEVLTKVDDLLREDTDPEDNPETRADAGSEDVYSDEDSRGRGILLHDMLSNVTTLDDVDRAVNQVALDKGLDRELREECRRFITTMLDRSNPLVTRWFEDNCSAVTEQSIYLPGDGTTRRPDRLVFNNDGSLDVIDYKFTASDSVTHFTQVDRYVAILRDMGYDRVNGYLWYPLSGRIIDTKRQQQRW